MSFGKFRFGLAPFGKEPATGSSTQSYTVPVSGGITFGGSATELRTRVAPVAGGITFAGTATELRTRIVPVSGGIVFGGAASITERYIQIRTVTPSGGIVFGGTGTAEGHYVGGGASSGFWIINDRRRGRR